MRILFEKIIRIKNMLPIHNQLYDSIVGGYLLHCIVVNSAGSSGRIKNDLFKKLLVINYYYLLQ